MKKIFHKNSFWFLLCAALLSVYLYLCFAYNLQFYTEDERYVQLDMTNLGSLYQWNMTNYRISSSLGCFIYYPLNYTLKLFSGGLSLLTGGDLSLLIIPMMLSKLVHSVMVIAGWLWFAVEAGRLLHKKWGITPWSALLCFMFTAMAPVNIFLVKTNNYDSIYNILCLIAGIYFYRYILSKDIRELGGSFFLFALAMQEKFAAYPIFIVALFFVPFFMKTDKRSNYIKEYVVIIAAITLGSILPTLFRGIAELFWAPDASTLYKHLSLYQPFFTFPKAVGTAFHFMAIETKISTIIVKFSFILHILGFVVWSFFIVSVREKNNLLWIKSKKALWVNLGGIVQVFFLLWAFAPIWYTLPESGKYPFDAPPAGTYLPPHLGDSQVVFYHGTNHFEYIFIRLMQTIGFFKPMVYSPMLILLLLGPVCTFFSFRIKDEKLKSIAILSAVIFNVAMCLVLLVNLTGVPFGGRYANIYVTLLGMSSFLTVLVIIFLVSGIQRLNDKKLLPAAVMLFSVIFMAEIWPYGPSYQVFGNWFYPAKGCGGWGEPSSALVQAARKDPFLKQALGSTYTTYTGLAIEKPFFTPLINFRLIQSRSKEHSGKRRQIQYMLAETTAIGQNPWLKKVRDLALTVDGAVVWKWECRGAASAWLIDLYKLGIKDFENQIDPKNVERHYQGEWFF